MVYIAHHGIKGQKWGIRRFQNEDGTLTEAGKRRLEKMGSEDYREVKQLKKKKTKYLSNDELRKIVERNELENKVNEGRNKVRSALLKTGGKLLGVAAVSTAAILGGKYVMKHLPDIAGAIAKGTANAAANVAKGAAEKVVETGHEIRKKVAETEGARKYREAFRKVVPPNLRRR